MPSYELLRKRKKPADHRRLLGKLDVVRRRSKAHPQSQGGAEASSSTRRAVEVPPRDLGDSFWEIPMSFTSFENLLSATRTGVIEASLSTHFTERSPRKGLIN